MKKTRAYLLLALSILFFTNCANSKKLIQVTTNSLCLKIQAQLEMPMPVEIGNIRILTDLLPQTENPIEAQKIKSYFIPAIVYWNSVQKIHYQIDNGFFTSLFANVLLEKLDIIPLDEMLEGRKMEIEIEAIPNTFFHESNYTILFFVLAYTINYNEENYQEIQNYKLSYRIFDEKQVIREGSYSRKYISDPLRNENQSQEEFINNYLNVLKVDFEKQCEGFLRQIANEILEID